METCYPRGNLFPSPGPRVDCWAFSQQPARGQGLPICRKPPPASAEGSVPKKFRQNGCFGGAKRSERGLGESLLKRFPQEAGTGLRPLAQGCAGAGKIVFPPRHACGLPWYEPTAYHLPPPEEAIPVPGAPSGLLGFLPTTGEGPRLAHLPEAAPSLGRGKRPKKIPPKRMFWRRKKV